MLAAMRRAAVPEAKEGHVAFCGYRTWYRITGNLDLPEAPLVVAHG